MTFMRPIVFSSADVVERRVAEANERTAVAYETTRRVVAERDAAREDWRREREAHGIAIQNANESVKRAEAAEARVQESEADYGRERQRADTYQLRCDQAEARVRELERILDENIANLGSRDAELARVRAELASAQKRLAITATEANSARRFIAACPDDECSLLRLDVKRLLERVLKV